LLVDAARDEAADEDQPTDKWVKSVTVAVLFERYYRTGIALGDHN